MTSVTSAVNRARVPELVAGLILASAVSPAQTTTDPRLGGQRWGAAYFPNVELTTHEGKSVRFFDDLLEDKVVVINFIYTSCPDVCPLETAKLAEVQAVLGDRVGDDVFLYSITIDPEVDTPEVLAKYAERYGAGPGWVFLTGEEDDITLLRRKLGLYIEEIQDEESSDHNLSLILGNQRTGRWMKRSPFESPYYLANQIGGWLHNWKVPDTNQESYASAPELAALTTGERLFMTRCAACHVVGGAEFVPSHQDGRLLGPDLLGVTERRDPAWLARWLAEPDKMLAEEDPLAMELYARHNRVAMPNMALKGSDVEALIEYLATESRRYEALERTRPPAKPEDSFGELGSCCRKNDGKSQTPDDAPPTGGAPVATATNATAQAVDERRPSEPGHVRSATLVRSSVGLGFFFLVLGGLVRRRESLIRGGRP